MSRSNHHHDSDVNGMALFVFVRVTRPLPARPWMACDVVSRWTGNSCQQWSSAIMTSRADARAGQVLSCQQRFRWIARLLRLLTHRRSVFLFCARMFRRRKLLGILLRMIKNYWPRTFFFSFFFLFFVVKIFDIERHPPPPPSFNQY